MTPVSKISTDASGDDSLTFSSDDNLLTASDEALSISSPLTAASTISGGLTLAAPAARTTTTYDTVTVKNGDVTFNLKFVAADSPTAAFMTEIEKAAKILSAAITDTMTLNIVVGYGEVEGTKLTSGESEGGPLSGTTYAYSSVLSALDSKDASDPALSSLPTGTTFDGYSQVVVWSAEAKALGLESGANTADDGVVGFAAGISDDEMIGVALHELTHAMGRTAYGPTPDVFDFTRFTSAGVYDTDDNTSPSSTNLAPAAYFSVDGGKTELAAYGQNSDPGDFANSNYGTPEVSYSPDDAFDQYYSNSTVQGLTSLDLTELSTLGFNTSAATATPCFVTGTAIRTTRGDVAVEKLAVGDLVVTASGDARPVKWIGRRALDLRRHPDPERVTPVRVAAGAFGAGLPYRDLLLSPDHSLAFEGALIPVSRLVNGRSVAPKPCSHVEYWHVELDAHDVIFAEGLAAESYLDTGNRMGFVNGGAFVEAHPDFRPKFWAETCLPLVCDGPPVVAAKRRLLEALGEGVSGEHDAHLVVDGRRVDPVLVEGALVFTAPQDGKTLVLRSRRFVPAHSLPESQDSRSLGLSVARLEIDGVACALDGFDGAGWHEPEYDARGGISHRWTDGEAQLPAGSRSIVVTLAGPGFYLGPAARSEPAAA